MKNTGGSGAVRAQVTAVDLARTIGERIRRGRTARGWSQQDVADAMAERGFSWRQTTVAKTELAQRPVLAEEAVALAAVFGVSLDELLVAGDKQMAFWDYLTAEARFAQARRHYSEIEDRLAEARRGVDEAAEQLETARSKLANFDEGKL